MGPSLKLRIVFIIFQTRARGRLSIDDQEANLAGGVCDRVLDRGRLFTIVRSRANDVTAPSPASSPLSGDRSGSAPEDSERIAELTATVKLVAQEYALAVDDAGVVVDDTEIAEAELFTDQARSKYQRLSPQVKTGHAQEAAAAEGAINRLGDAVSGRRPPGEVRDLSVAAAEALGKLGPSESAATVGLRSATDQADRTIVAEEVVGDYRVGVLVEPPLKLFRSGPGDQVVEVPAPAGAGSFIGVVLRERRTKRFLPGAIVRVTLGEGKPGAGNGANEVMLQPIWADFPLYGGHLAKLPEGAGRLQVHVDPPQCARHADMLRHADKPADAEFAFTSLAGRPTFTPKPPGPQDADYSIGDDILRGLTEARETVRAGPYRIGFIAEPPEPFWLWNHGPELKPVSAGATHHLEVMLLDTTSGQLVPGAEVQLTLTPVGGQASTLQISLHELLSAYQHYGETLSVPPGDYEVRVEVKPPSFDVTDVRRLMKPASATFRWSVPAGKGGAA
jgi:hypothetical protein